MFERFHKIMSKEWLETMLTIMENQYHVTTVLRAFVAKFIEGSLGLDRLGLSRPDKAMYRLVRKRALHPKKNSGHLAFDKKELDMVATRGDEKRQRGRPRKYDSA